MGTETQWLQIVDKGLTLLDIDFKRKKNSDPKLPWLDQISLMQVSNKVCQYLLAELKTPYASLGIPS